MVHDTYIITIVTIVNMGFINQLSINGGPHPVSTGWFCTYPPRIQNRPGRTGLPDTQQEGATHQRDGARATGETRQGKPRKSQGWVGIWGFPQNGWVIIVENPIKIENE